MSSFLLCPTSLSFSVEFLYPKASDTPFSLTLAGIIAIAS